ncbi:LacI family DNA-binding transcriptional regulator [Microbacterium sp.]|uniref:LacI family DNA-binding transcriptional regulator n=1 Tax=Microbacterium sp. TaxID=51671 RepID=UPI0039E6CF30
MVEEAPRRPTLADVARLAGMSKSATSMILNNKEGSRLSAAAAERVRAAATELGYRPNPAAQSLRLGHTRTLGFVSDNVTLTRYASAMIRGVLDTAAQHDHTVLITETGGDPQRLDASIQSMLDRRVDGILVGLFQARMVDVPRIPANLPLLIVNGTTPQDHPSVLPGEYAAGRTVAEFLLNAGHRRIAFIGPVRRLMNDPRQSVSIDDRLQGMDDAFAAGGVSPLRVDVAEWTVQLGYEHALRTITTRPELTAIVAGNDNIAFGVYQAMHELGLRIPHDLSVISFDDEEVAAYQRPGLTTARLPYQEMAQRAVEMLLGRREPAHETLPMPLVVRESVGPPRD